MHPNPEYLDDEYQTKLKTLVDGFDAISYAEAESVFLDECEQLHEFLKDDTPVGVIQRATFSSTESHFRYK